ncbi:MAG: DUF427 domain-containing protein [Actinomycetota bacterium]
MSTTRGRVRIEASAKRIRAFLGGVAVVDTTRPVLVWEGASYPAYYFPADDVRMELLQSTATEAQSPSRGVAAHFTIRAGDEQRIDAAWQYRESPIEELRNLVRFDWNAMDSWLEEDEEVFVHPRSPYTRVDILPTSRHVRVEIDGVVFAESAKTRVLFETGLPPRWYLPEDDVRMDLLVPTDQLTGCPYKGRARYWSARVRDRIEPNIAWSYPTPLPESERIEGLLAFYDERVDVLLDGVRQDRPKTHFA